MAKGMNPALRAAVERRKEEKRKVNIALQMAEDAAMIAAQVIFGMGPKRAADFHAAYVRTVNDMARLLVADAKDDEMIEYTKETVDKRIRQIVGPEAFRPWDERYYHD